MITSFLLALQFLTVIPVKIKQVDEQKLAKSMVYFPLIGLLLGFALIGINNLFLYLNFPEISINIILVISLIVLTGGIHLDGLADTADALLSRKNKEEMLAIMRDSHIGVMGVLSLISIILLKVAFLFSASTQSKIAPLLLMCVLSRWSMVFAMLLFPYARQEGKAKIFIQGINLKIFIFATVIALVTVFAAWQIKGLLVFAIVGLYTFLTGKLISRKIGGVTGDTLGAINELAETVTLLSIAVVFRY